MLLTIDEYDTAAQDYLYRAFSEKMLWQDSAIGRAYGEFFSTIKFLMNRPYGIRQVFMCGIMPLLLTHSFSGFNIVENLSFRPNFATLFGFTHAEVNEVLNVVCKDKSNIDKIYNDFAYQANGYHFCREKRVDTVFNTQTTIAALNVSLNSY